MNENDDFTEADFDELKRKAEHGDAGAQCSIGKIYEEGNKNIYIGQNFKEALKFYKMASVQNNAEALYRIGNMHYMGKATPSSYEIALDYFTFL